MLLRLLVNLLQPLLSYFFSSPAHRYYGALLKHSIMSLLDTLGIGALGAGINSLFNGASQSAANQQAMYNSLELQRNQNSFNEYMYDRARFENRQDAFTSFQRQQQLMQYQLRLNSPSAQIARLRAAGINPNIAFSNGGINNVASPSDTPSSAPVSPSSASSAMFSQQPIPDANSFIASMSAASNLQYQDKQAKAVGLSNQHAALENYILSRTAEDKIKGIKGAEDARRLLGDYQRQLLVNLGNEHDLMSQEYSFNEDYNPKRLASAEQDIQLKAQQWQIQDLNRKILQIDADNHKKMVALQLVAQIENIRTLQTQQFLNTKQALAAIQMARQTAANAFGMEKENSFNFGDSPLTDDDGSINWKGILHGLGEGLKLWLTRKSKN